MKLSLAILPVLILAGMATARAAEPHAAGDVGQVAPALQGYTDRVLESDVWKRPGLAPRDRSIATVSALVASGQTGMLKAELNRALDNGVKPADLGAILTHLAFYAGWPNALSAVGFANTVFVERGIAAQPAATLDLEKLPIDEKADQARAAGVSKAYGAVSPSIVRDTNDLLFQDLWRRPDLSPRDRSLVTISALIGGGHAGQLPFHLDCGMTNGLTKAQIGEVIAQLAFYAGWPNALSAVPATKATFDKHPG